MVWRQHAQVVRINLKVYGCFYRVRISASSGKEVKIRRFRVAVMQGMLKIPRKRYSYHNFQM